MDVGKWAMVMVLALGTILIVPTISGAFFSTNLPSGGDAQRVIYQRTIGSLDTSPSADRMILPGAVRIDAGVGESGKVMYGIFDRTVIGMMDVGLSIKIDSDVMQVGNIHISAIVDMTDDMGRHAYMEFIFWTAQMMHAQIEWANTSYNTYVEVPMEQATGRPVNILLDVSGYAEYLLPYYSSIDSIYICISKPDVRASATIDITFDSFILYEK